MVMGRLVAEAKKPGVVPIDAAVGESPDMDVPSPTNEVADQPPANNLDAPPTASKTDASSPTEYGRWSGSELDVGGDFVSLVQTSPGKKNGRRHVRRRGVAYTKRIIGNRARDIEHLQSGS